MALGILTLLFAIILAILPLGEAKDVVRLHFINFSTVTLIYFFVQYDRLFFN